MSEPWTELEHMKRLVRADNNHWRGRRVFSCEVAGQPACENALYGGYWPNMSGIYAPTCKEVASNWGFRKGRIRVVASYWTGPWGDLRDRREIGRSRIVCQAFGQPRKATHDLDGSPIDYPASDGFHEWTVVRGDNTVMDRKAVVRVQTAYNADEFNLQSVMAKIDRVNNGALNLSGFGTAGEETLKLMDFQTVRWHGDALMYADYVFGYEPDGWNTLVKTQRGLWAVVQRAVWKESWAALDVHASSLVFRSGKHLSGALTTILDSEILDTRIYDTTSFSDLAGLTEW